jgi:2-oxoglutarate dehydrogenase E2 component (dihydrolipoamide succinyltransferase)
LEIRVQENETVEVGAIVAIMGEAGEQLSSASSTPSAPTASASSEATHEPVANATPAHEIVMPQMGESVAEGTIVRWMKKAGDTVEVDEPIFEITTDKVDTEIPSPEAGTLLEIVVGEGETVEVGAIVAYIGSPGASTSTASSSASTPAAPVATSAATTPAVSAPAASSAPAVAVEGLSRAEMSAADLRRVRSTPVVRKIAAEHNVDIRGITGSGLDGRVTKKDIEAYIASGAHLKAVASTPAVSSAPKASPVAARSAAPAPAAAASSGRVSLSVPMVPVTMHENDSHESMSRMRKTISDRMIESKQYSAHVHTCFEIEYGKVDALRKKYKREYSDRGAKLTFTTFLAHAAIKALRAFPIVNSSHDGENVIYRGDINLGIAVAVDWGLLVPVVHNADELSMLGLSKKIADLGERSRTKKLKPDEVQGLTFSITNPGIFGSQWGTPIIPQPSVAIMGVGTIEKRVKVITLPDGTDTFAVKLCGYLTLGFDHRVIDGAVADKFMGFVKQTLENFDESAL